jgi:putative CocE/NonD family hydrolase
MKPSFLILPFLLAAGAFAARPPEYEVEVQRDLRVRMRDGVQLATDLYIPVKNGQPPNEKLPALLLRTPYDKASWGVKVVRWFAERGYLVVTQDCRGRYRSGGKFFPFAQEPNDGADTLAWLAKHPLCNGKVGMFGPSYMGWAQFEAATQRPPALMTMIPMQAPINAYHYSMRCGGALHLGLLRWVVGMASSSQEAARDPAVATAIRPMLDHQRFLEWAGKIPWQRGATPLARIPQYEDVAFQLYFENNDYTAFWRQPGLAMDEHFDSFPTMPVLWVTSWFDWYPRTICDGYQRMVAMGRKDQHLLIGPWTHYNFDNSPGDVNFGNEGAPFTSFDDFSELQARWFDRWLKGDRAVELGPPVRFFMMGGGDGKRGAGGRLNHGGRWLASDCWPPKGVVSKPIYLADGGKLSFQKPAEKQSSRAYRYDPRNTVSSNGRCIVPYGPSARDGFRGMGPRDQIELKTLPGHGTPGKPIADRADVLTYQTEPLAKEVRIAGDMHVRLWVSSDAPDTDFHVKLTDLHPPSPDYPQGYAFPVSEGILRARYRESFERPAPLQPGQLYQLKIPLEPAANLFKAGHRIRVDICSSSFPNFDINPNTGNPDDRRPRIAVNTVYHQLDHASCVELPVLE